MKKLIIIILILGWASTAVAGAAYREQAIRADSMEAVADTARLLELESLGDSVTAYQQRSVQLQLVADSLDRELSLRPVIRVSAGIEIDTLRIVDTVPAPVFEDTVEVYEFGGQDGPFTFVGDARLFPNRTQVFNVSVSSDPVGVGVRVHCGSGRAIRKASVLLTAEDPFQVIPTHVEQEVGVCNEPFTPKLLPEISLKGIGYDLAKVGVGFLLGRWSKKEKPWEENYDSF